MTYHLPKGNPVFVLKETKLSLEAKGAWCMMRFLGGEQGYRGEGQFPQAVLDELVSTQHLIIKEVRDEES